ncbi:1-(5-phosphoribosyl)-5-[(5-phosphoribosylamino)methylideneamino]imidazole-4-carboxamide isomerase [Halothermothrix orenii]|uniref:1-(5-phosphoribosyl)-5-[(5-phosphoribosylamino)methylideneamino] imidazole-4-carboxamide isomerase n=1 Tax=Halothermothrix orenii (strain H 168 / OCM 544 / DSM 9562) TaxID=373903 RepID=HIS4_HALOH|nr:1-(5-phosphoribosyl)-5-[(5-phosphoribosylamino)methylideneamino]imidazole-4-carboxamide isomerase [Halothermothrix orenii]B8D115.1 RecName: Full=1-(5-phosphoribosyl)-5-[(5-phosphoribosylamino)methylideneamino] imidazole-4-carboxamide isomerase; AltName: Full=Phosphoribosylformimino-5-aminoimidazole carboxamide ribotide isomerase [Halothermothrix orenii H 168]ACL68984.1 phosphoribosylformimino-5-aminoimidazole carboxamide ribotide isomerase [Halothermothrix orenii H 168]
MEVIPAVDIKDGSCVRLKKGDFNKRRVYSTSPVDVALYWEKHGASRLHIVDLDGAKSGWPTHLKTIREIALRVNIPLQVGGGIRSLKVIKKYLDSGVDRIILGTVALKNPELVKRALDNFGSNRIVVGVDARGGKVATEGWLKTSQVTVEDIISEMEEVGVKTFIYTDINRDGMLKGPDIEGIKRVLKSTKARIIASGGISSRQDLINLKAIGIKAAIVGKALYEGNLPLEVLNQYP